MGSKLEQCGGCRGFVPRRASRCPHCSEAAAHATGAGSRGLARRLGGALGGAFGGGAIAFTLMACYGAAPPPPCPDGTRNCLQKTDETPPATSATPAAASTAETPAAPDGGK